MNPRKSRSSPRRYSPRCAEQGRERRRRSAIRWGMAVTPRPRLEIEYCTQCRWLLRAAWMAQELLTTFEAEIGAVALVPGAGGIFEGRVGAPVLWAPPCAGRFTDAKRLQHVLRD